MNSHITMSNHNQSSKDLDEVTRQKFRLEAVEFDINDLEKFFISASFQREKQDVHIRKIERAILEGKMYDNIITVYKLDGLLKVLDGQHRLSAYIQVHNKTGLYSPVKLWLRYVEAENESEAREIYRRLNSGKKLDLSDYLKSLDNGTHLFFNGLRNYCTHSKRKGSVTYRDAYNMISTSKYAGGSPTGILPVEGILKKISEDDVAYCKKFIDVLTSLENIGMFRYSRLITRVYSASHRNKLDAVDFAIRLPRIADSDRIAKFISKYGFSQQDAPAFTKLIESELLS